MKNSFSLLELILTIAIGSAIIIFSVNYAKDILQTDKQNYTLQTQKLDLQSTKIFLQKHKDELNLLKYKDKTLFFQNQILLEDVNSFDIKYLANNTTIKINLDDKIKQIWKISK